jgi:hypothetical protein
MMNFKAFLFILFLAGSSIESFELVDCDSLFLEAEDAYLGEFLIRHDLINDYERRNQDYDACFHFLGRFFLLIDQYRSEEGKQDAFKFNKRAYRMRPKGVLKFNF